MPFFELSAIDSVGESLLTSTPEQFLKLFGNIKKWQQYPLKTPIPLVTYTVLVAKGEGGGSGYSHRHSVQSCNRGQDADKGSRHFQGSVKQSSGILGPINSTSAGYEV